jgi:hypothetical protein
MNELNEKPATAVAAGLLSANTAFRGPMSLLLFDLIAMAIKELAQGCAPTPNEAAAYLNWKPLFPNLMGWRLTQRRRTMAALIAREAHAIGMTAAEIAEINKNLTAAIEDGKVTPAMMASLYRESGV